VTQIPPLMGRAPISQRLRTQFERDSRSVESLLAAAERKGYTQMSRWEAEEEYRTARTHFELGCWLAHYADRLSREANPQVRIDCVRRIWESDITNPGYRFFTIFGFGERNFDTCFEMGDGDKVAAALKAMAIEDPTGPIAAGVRAFGWNKPAPVEAAEDLLERLGAHLDVPDIRDRRDTIEAAMAARGYQMDIDPGAVPGEGHLLLTADGEDVALDADDLHPDVCYLAREWSALTDQLIELDPDALDQGGPRP